MITNYSIRYTLFLSLIFYTGLAAQDNSLVPEGFYTNPIETPFGVLASNEYESTLYLIKNNEAEAIISAPGCARYISLSEDRTRIGFKLIDPVTGRQAPAVYDLTSGSIVKLHEDSGEAGQVSFSRNGRTAYTVGNDLYITQNGMTDIYNLGIYVNRATISPDGNYVIYKDEDDQLVKFDLSTETGEVITDDQNGYYNASWSPDSKYITFQSIDAKVYLFDNSNSEIKIIADGENPRWSEDSRSLAFVSKEIDFENIRLIRSEIFNYDIAGKKLDQLTNTVDIHEMDPSFSKDSKMIYYHTYGRREIIRRELEKDAAAEKVTRSDTPLKIKKFETLKKNSGMNETTEAPDWIHIHQVFDTRDSGSWTNDPVNGDHQGYNACGATSAMEIVATYGILPPDPINTYGHTSNYGKYISDAYTINDYTFSGFNINPNGNPGFRTGAHGFMWNYGSPNSNTVSFLEKHGIEANHSSSISWSKVKSELDKNFPYILCSISLTSGHIVTAIGQYGNGHTLYCNDPYGDKNAGSYGRIRNGKNAIYDWADANTGHVKITPVVWGVTARYSRSLNLMATYPEDNEKDVSTTVVPMLQFYGDVDPNSLDSKIELMDQFSNPVTFTLNLDRCDDGIVYIIPSVQLDAETEYKIIVRYGIESTTGLQLNKNAMVQFATGRDIVVDDIPYDDYESRGNWELVSSGINETSTALDLSNELSISGSNSAKLEYEFTSSGYCRILYSPEIEIGDLNNSSVGIWVNGDCSGNNFEIWFSDGNNVLERGLEKSLDWSGWKFISFDAVNLTDKNKKYFNCFAVRKKTGALTSGMVYFDDLTIFETYTSVSSHTPSKYDEGIPVDTPIVIDFNRSMNTAAAEDAFNIDPYAEGSFYWTNGDKNLTFTPSESLSGNTEYIVTIMSSAADISGKNLSNDYIFSFVTERTSLTLDTHYPLQNETGVSVNPKVVLSFDAPIDPSTLAGNILFKDEYDDDIEIVVDFTTYSRGLVVFEPEHDLEENKEYRLILKPAISGNDNLTYGLDTEIGFTTETDMYVSGNLMHEFENSSVWINPLNAEGSVGLDYLNNSFSLTTHNTFNGDNSGMLEYSFNGIEGVCRLQNTSGMEVGASEQFGMWIYGDFSNNKLEYWFADAQSNLHTIEVSDINWTGWKLKTVDLSELSQYDDIAFNSIVIKQADDGTSKSTLYFDDIQRDIVLPVTEEEKLPTHFSLSQNYPNPFNPSTVIEYSIPVYSRQYAVNSRKKTIIRKQMTESGNQNPASSIQPVPAKLNEAGHQVSVSLKVYDILGREVAILVNEMQKPGIYKVQLDAGNYASGVYIYSLSAGSFHSTKKMLMLK